MRTLTLTKKDSRILVGSILPMKRQLAKKQDKTGEYRLWSRFASLVDDALGEYGEAVYNLIDQATVEADRLGLDGAQQSRDERKAEQQERLQEINARLNAQVRDLDDEHGAETIDVEMTDGLHRWLIQTWELPGGFDDSRENRRRFLAIDEALRAAGKANDDEPVPLKKRK